jgi:hypothetical protein
MTCVRARRQLSAWIDGELSPGAARAVAAHLGGCPACARRAAELRELSRLLGDLPRLEPPEPIAAQVCDRLDLETRGPALALLLRRGIGTARPLMMPSLVPAALVVVTVLAAAVALDSGARAPVSPPSVKWYLAAASGTEANPLFPSAGVELPRARNNGGLLPDVLAATGEDTIFLETVVARDGSVALVTVLDGNEERAGALVDALRRQRFEPVRYHGRPVAVSVYRLISRLEVRSPVT